MLNKLFGSKSRAEILKTFLNHPERKHYIRQLARDLDMQVNSVRRELGNLESFGLLKSQMVTEDFKRNDDSSEQTLGEFVDSQQKQSDGSENNAEKKGLPFGGKVEKKYFTVDKEFALYEELRSLILKSKTLYEKNFVDRIKDIGKPKLFVLTGIFVGNPNASTDMLIVGEVDRSRLVGVVETLEKEFEREINYTIMDEREFLYRRDITDVFIYGILENKKIVVCNEFGFIN